MATVRQLQAHRTRLTERLSDGWRKIDNAAPGTDVTAWEDHWIALLGQFEACEHWLAIQSEVEAQERAQAGALVQGQISISAGVR